MREKVIDILRQILVEMGHPEDIPVEKRLTRYMDSLDIIGLVIRTEDEFKVSISDDEMADIVSLDDLRVIVEEHLGISGEVKSITEPFTVEDCRIRDQKRYRLLVWTIVFVGFITLVLLSR